jgi:hypothetical protein
MGEPPIHVATAIFFLYESVTLLRLRALLARARSDSDSYRDWVSRYRAMAESLGFEGHLDRAEMMIQGEE